MVWRVSACALLLRVRDLCQGGETQPEVDGKRHYIEFWQCHRELRCDAVVDSHIVWYGVSDGELCLDNRNRLQHREWEPAGDVEPESKVDVAGTVRTDREWIGYREPDDQQ